MWNAALLALTMLASPLTPVHHEPRDLDVQAHRGGLGLRVENTLAAFGNALRLGVDTLELDVQITLDGHAVVTHDRRINPAKCLGAYGGRYIKDLTLAQVRTMDCGSQTVVPGQQLVPGAPMPLLSEVFDLVKRYHARDVKLNIETKVEAGAPHETAPREQFVQVVNAEIERARIGRQVTIQSFDWGALMRWREVAPQIERIALTNYTFLQVGQPGASPWLGGLDIDDFGGDPIAAVKTFGVTAFSPVHGFPQHGTVNDPSYVPYVTADMVRHAHRNGIKVIPWTVNDIPTMRKLIADGIDGLITDYPDRLRTLVKNPPRGYESPFDVQAHRGGGKPENTLKTFRKALSNPDISTIELDTGLTRDGHLVVSHERRIDPAKCQGGFAGTPIKDLILAQIQTLDCGEGERMPTLAEVLDLVKPSNKRLNIETKISPLAPDTAGPDTFTRKLIEAIQRAHMTDRVTIQSFDWRTIALAKKLNPRIHTVALVWQYGPTECASPADECSLQAVYGDPSVKSPWTANLDWWKHRDLGKLMRESKADTVSSNWQVHDPNQGTVSSPDWYLRENPAYFHGPTVDRLQERYRLKVVPYTVNDEAVMHRLIALGVDGIITDDPELLIKAARRHGLR
ncbi:glycerophosphodiester phosphodiesterase family protein [Allorhizocola rhizosphaerae]|uniref:glycerophosphodiester phosphodiesterase family protein n=1 Tax=Allorhizocola rhizosphaerae TaxID=1872709 RepID=UPI000E3CBE74|nr:glycerophosphodiester phosphodiesterase family protein [Allorhizocola rhizosphaerae]